MREQISRTVQALLDGPGDPTELKGAVLDLARVGQVGLSDDALFGRVAGPMRAQAEAAFGPLTLLLVLTEEGRRQVYFAALSGLSGAGRLEAGALTPEGRAELVSALLTLGNEALIRWAFGSCPPGFVRVLSRFKDRARSPDLYRRLHALLTEDPELGPALPALLSVANLDNDLIDLFRVLPRTREGREMAVLFRSERAYNRFRTIYRSLTGKPELTPGDRRKLFEIGDSDRFLLALYRGTPFPEPVIMGCAYAINHVADWADLKRVALEFKNCLTNYLDEVIRGDHQYYVWEPVGESPVVFCLRRDGPFGWYLLDLRLKGNEVVPEGQQTRLREILADLGVLHEESMENILKTSLFFSDEDDEEDQDPEDLEDLDDQLEEIAEEPEMDGADRRFEAELTALFDDAFDGFGRRAA